MESRPGLSMFFSNRPTQDSFSVMTGKLKLTARRMQAVTMMVEIARKDRKTPVSLPDLASTLGVSVSYMEQCALGLRRAGLLRSFRGPGGGYMLAKPAAEISILDISLSSKDLPGEGDNREDAGLLYYSIPCAQDLWNELEICQYLLLQHISLADIVGGKLHAHSFLKGIRDFCDQASNKTSTDFDTKAHPTTAAA
jgi:Rrf2 family iron-sulfur cluster assembly transcriptional regulator